MNIISYQEEVRSDYNKPRAILQRAREISNEYRVKHGMLTVEEELSRVIYNATMPETFQQRIHPAHCFNLYLKELRERYLH